MTAKFGPGDIILLCGYRRVGKDTFYQAMKTGDISQYTVRPNFPSYDPSLVRRIAFGDVLKIRVAEILGLNLQELEAKKDQPLERDYIFAYHHPDVPTYRDVMIDQALVVKRLDPSYFVRYTMENCYSSDVINVVTDLRFHVELNYLKEHFAGKYCIARINRPGFLEPAIDDVYERELDNVFPDYLISCN